MGSNITIKDIARNLKVSPSTVSRALNDNPEISVETKKRVWQLAKELDYEPNTIALSLKQRKTNTIGVILPELVHFFFSTVIAGIEEVANAHGYNVIVTQSNDELEREISVSKTLYNHRVDGILASISMNTINHDHFNAIIDKGIPVVFLDRAPHGMDASSVLVDDFQGGYLATKHLIEQGRKNIIHLTGPRSLDIIKLRMEGAQKALTEFGFEVRDDHFISCKKGSSPAETQEIISHLLQKGTRIDGVFAHNDIWAYGAMKGVMEAGLKVPDDISVVGFSDWMFCSFTNPTLSTIQQPGYLMGQQATELIIKEIKVEDNKFIEPAHIVLPVELIKRASS